MKQQDLTN